MGLAFGLEDSSAEALRKFRWIFQLVGISASDNIQNGLYSLPPRKSARPSLQFKTQAFEHLTETIYMPMKPDWQAVNLTLYDLKRCDQQNKYNAVYQWLRSGNPAQQAGTAGLYDPRTATWTSVLDGGFKRTSQLVMLDSCGNVMETWVYENSFPESIDWGELEMSDSEVVTVSISLRYDRAYQLV